MLETAIAKLIEKLVATAKSPEDLILLLFVFGFGMLMTRLLPRFSKKPDISEKNEKLCPITGQAFPCKSIPDLRRELEITQEDLDDVCIKNAKLMNIISKEYEGKWDRYLYDQDVTPSDDIVNIRRTRKK